MDKNPGYNCIGQLNGPGGSKQRELVASSGENVKIIDEFAFQFTTTMTTMPSYKQQIHERETRGRGGARERE